MPPKRKASALDTAAADPVSSGETEAESTSTAKRPRVSKTTKGRKAAAQAGDASGSAKDEDRSVDQQPETSSSSASPKSWSDVVLEGEDDDVSSFLLSARAESRQLTSLDEQGGVTV